MINIHKDLEHKVQSYRIYPVAEGIVAGMIIFLAVLVSSYFIYLRGFEAQKGEIREGILRTAGVIATMIDGDKHKTFLSSAQENDPDYQQALDPLRKALFASEDIKFLYTNVIRDGKAYFVLNPSPQDDNDKDGKPDRAPQLMDPYYDASETLMAALRDQKPTVSDEPYTDQWGSFMSAYVPFYDSQKQFVGTLGIDLEVSNYKARLEPIKRATMRAMVTGFFLSFLTGVTVWFIRRFAGEINESRKRIMGDLEDAVQVARNAAKAKSEFLANMSHEIRTPMNAILGFTKALMQTPLNDKQKEQIQTIEEAGGSLIGIINEILDLSKIEAGKVALNEDDFDLHRCVDNVIGLLASQADAKGLELCSIIAPEVPQALYGDQGRIRQVLINLIGNALKFTATGGVVLEISMLRDLGDKVEVGCKVTDTGIGISQEGLSKVFDEFAQANKTIESKYGGTGLGLAITRKLVHLMMGDISVQSIEGKGTTFSFTLELRKSMLEQANHFVEVHFSGRVLVVAENEVLRNALTEQLNLWGVIVESSDTASVFDKLVSASETPHPYDAVLLDKGQEETAFLVKKIRTHMELKKTKVVSLRKSTDVSLSEDDELFDATLSKPVKQKLLVKALNG